ncbi:MAG: hypothetical protein AAF799_02375 [Myxococcota bacterium]
MVLVAALAMGCARSPAEPTAPPEPAAAAEQVEQAEPSPEAQIDDLERRYGEAMSQRERLEPLAPELSAFVSANPDNASGWLIYSQVLLELEDVDGSMEAAERCVAVDSSTAGCWLTIGLLREIAGEREQAIGPYERYLELAPEGRYVQEVQKALKRVRPESPEPTPRQ